MRFGTNAHGMGQQILHALVPVVRGKIAKVWQSPAIGPVYFLQGSRQPLAVGAKGLNIPLPVWHFNAVVFYHYIDVKLPGTVTQCG